MMLKASHEREAVHVIPGADVAERARRLRVHLRLFHELDIEDIEDSPRQLRAAHRKAHARRLP